MQGGHIAERYLDGACIECKNPTKPGIPIEVICYEGPIISCGEALKLGLTRYFNGPDKPCKNGHIAERATSTWGCMECYRINSLSIHNARRDELNAARRTPARRAKATQRNSYIMTRPGNRTQMLQRKAREKGAEGVFTTEDEAKLRARQKHCHICGKRFTKADPATIDHVIALADGGRHDPSNIALAHLSCNCSKKDRRTHLI